jgi:hypothetical protein
MAQTTIQGSFLGDATVTGAKIGADFISAQTDLPSGLSTTDEIIVSDAGVIKRMDISVLEIAATQITANGTLPVLNGSNLTTLPAANLTGTLPAISGVNLTALNATNLGSGTVPVARLSAASTTASGIAELATTAEINTGTDTGRTVTPDGLAGSIYGETNLQFIVFDWGTALTTGNGKFYFYVPATLNGFVVQSVHAAMITAPAGADVLINIQKQGVDDIFSTPIKIAAGTLVSIDSGTGVWVINASFSTLTTGTIVRVDVDQVGSSTAGSGLYINLTCRRP